MSAKAATIVNVLDEDQVALDVQFLNHNTFGDKALRAEIVKLFTLQLDQSREKITEAVTAQDWRFVMHTLKGAAAAVGAIEMAELAGQWELQGLSATDAARHAVLTVFDRARNNFCYAADLALAA